MSTLSLSPQVFMILSSAIEQRLGLHYRAEDSDLLASKVSPRALERGFDSLLDYYYFLRYDAEGPAELDALAESLVVGETFFFREAEQLIAAIDTLLAPRLMEGARPRIWCAACATGEEPLSLAMLLDNRGMLDRCTIVASDLSRRSLGRAREGEFRGRSLRLLPHPEQRGHLITKGECAVASPRIVSAVDWRRINLIDEHAIAGLGIFDLVLCRNVLIYFSDETTRRVVRNIEGALSPGGALAIGVSESLIRFGTALECKERGGYFFYDKVGR